MRTSPPLGDKQALAGLKVVEFAHVIAGPLAGTLLADFGADVVHVEPPGAGDTGRKIGPHKDGVYLWWKVSARNKRSLVLDLRQEAGREVARELIEWADVVITNLRSATLDEWGLDWETAHRINPKVIYLQITGFGAQTSLRNAPGFGKVGEARSGVVNITGFEDGPPVHTGFSHADTVTALMAAYGVLAAAYRKAHDPDFNGEWIDLALFESLYRLIEWQVIVYDQLGEIPQRSGNRLAVSPAAVVNTYLTADDEWITVTSATVRSVHNVVKLLGLPIDDFRTVEQQRDGADLLDGQLATWAKERSTDDALKAMFEAEVVASRIFDVEDIVNDPIYAEREDIITIPDEQLGPVRMQGVIPKLHRHGGSVWRTGPALGEDNDMVLSEWLGMDADRISALKEGEVIGGDQ
ncbi:CaiB/BaiF CoA transferase family protein [Cumulibacter manganitolerans]|uniref:CaiB/BaiF CoA transferase family protein n=1 Tax=Cumulibacter manganitolerans TaxID=1884992 RepID=UPI0012965FC2|nr:CoA transferase [Cumulibacter manganitolerans]